MTYSPITDTVPNHILDVIFLFVLETFSVKSRPSKLVFLRLMLKVPL